MLLPCHMSAWHILFMIDNSKNSMPVLSAIETPIVIGAICRHVCWLGLYLPRMSVWCQRHHTLYRIIKKSLCTWWLYCNRQEHRDFLITLYNSLKIAAVICKPCLNSADYILSTECIWVFYDWPKKKNFISLKSMQPLISVMEMQCEVLVLLAGGKASIGRHNQWHVRCARQPQKKGAVAPLELSVGATRVDTWWRVPIRMWETSKNDAVRSCIQRDKLYWRFGNLI